MSSPHTPSSSPAGKPLPKPDLAAHQPLDAARAGLTSPEALAAAAAHEAHAAHAAHAVHGTHAAPSHGLAGRVKLLPEDAAGEDLPALAAEDIPVASMPESQPDPIDPLAVSLLPSLSDECVPTEQEECKDDDHRLLPLFLLGVGGAGAALALAGGHGHEATTPQPPTKPEPPTDPIPPVVVPPEVTPPEVTPPEVTPPEVTPPEVTPPEVTPPEVIPPEVTPPEVKPPEVDPPITPTLSLKHDSGTDGDGLTNDGTVHVDGLPEGADWQYRLGDGAWLAGHGDEVPHDAIGADGAIHLQVRQVALDGSLGGVAELHFELDTTVQAPTLALKHDTGLDGDGITADGSVLIGALEAGASWDYSLDDGLTWQVGSGSELPSDTFQQDGPVELLVRQTDAAGNVSGTSLLHFTLETHIGGLTPTLVADTGTSADDFVTSDARIHVAGLQDGARWEYRLSGDSDWHEGLGSEIAANRFTRDGNWTVEVRQFDAAGNVGETGTLSFKLDTWADTPGSRLTVDSGRDGDFITNDPTVEIDGVETAATWEYQLAAGGWIGGSGSRLTGAVAADGDVDLHLRQTDLAGNVSTPGHLRFTLDTDGSTSTLFLTLQTDSGVAGDYVSNALDVTVHGVEPGASWQYQLEGAADWTDGVLVGDGGAIPASLFQGDGNHVLLVRQIDVAGNPSEPLRARLVLDTQVAKPVPHLAADTGSLGDDGLTRDGTVLVDGVEHGARWYYSLDHGATWTRGSGDRINANVFADGDVSLRVRQIDLAGNVSEDGTLDFHIDTGAAAPGVALSHDTGSSASDRLTSDATILISGLEAGARWQYRIDGGAWTDGSGDRIAADRFSADGDFHVLVRQIDVAGNTSTTQLLDFSLDTHVDTPAPKLSNDSGVSASDGITRDAAVSVGRIEAGAHWTYSLDGGATFSAGTGTSIPATVFTKDGAVDLLVRQTDAAGNSADATLSFTRRTSTGPLDLSDLDGLQDLTRGVLDGRAAAAGAPLTALQGRLTADDAHALSIVLGGEALDTVNDRWVLDTDIPTGADAARDDAAFAGLSGLSYRYEAGTHELRIWHTDGSALSGADLTALTNGIRFRNMQTTPQLGERVATLTVEDMAGNVSKGSTVVFDVDTRMPGLDLNGALAGVNADGATAHLDQAVTLFASDLAISHENPNATVRNLRVVLTGPGASRDDDLVSTDHGVATVLGGSSQHFDVGGVAWVMNRVSDTYTLARADGANAAVSEAENVLRTLGVRNSTALPLQGDRTYAVVVTDQNGRIARASGTVTYDTIAPAPDLNGSATGVDRTVVVTPGLPWAFAVAHPATGHIVESDSVTAVTLSFASSAAGAFDTVKDSAGEWIGFFDEANGADRGAMMRLGQAGTLQTSQIVSGRLLTLSLTGGATPVLTVTSDAPLSADQTSQLLRALYYTSGLDTALGDRTVSVAGTDRAGNTTQNQPLSTLEVRAIDTPVVNLSHDADTGLYANDVVTMRNGSAAAPLIFSGFAAAGQALTIFEDRNGDGAISSGETLGNVVTDASGRWSFTLSNKTLADGAHRIMATDGSLSSGVLDLTVDTRPPASTFSLGQSVKVLPVLTGTADPDMAVRVSLDTDGNVGNGYEVRYDTRTDAAGRWTLDTATATPADGQTHRFTTGEAVSAQVVTHDLAGNETVRTASSMAIESVYSVSDSHVIEGVDGQRELVFLVSRTGDLSASGSVHFAVDQDASSAKAVVGGALADNDYEGATSGTLDFAAGESSRLVHFTVNGDHYREVNDKLIVRLDSAVGGDIKDGLGIGNINEIDIDLLQAAYGLRDLNPRSNDFAVRVRRSSDNAEQDIGFDADGELDTDALLAFVGTGTTAKGYVTRWYDQSGHGRDMTQADTTRQGVIVDAGRIVERADGSAAISFNSGRNGAKNDYMVADGIAASDWQSAAFYAKVQSEGNGDGTLFNFGDANLGRLSSHYPATREGYVFDVGAKNPSIDRLTRAIPSGTSLTGLANDIVFEAHAGNMGAGTASLNYTDGKQVIYENGVQVTSDDTLSDSFSTTAEWKLAWHGAYSYGDSKYYQQAMYNEFLVYLAKDNSTPEMHALQGTTGNDVLTYSGEAGLAGIDGLAGEDTLYLSGSVNLDFAAFPEGVHGIEQVWMENGAANTLTLTTPTLIANGASTLTVRLDAGDVVVLDGQRFEHDAGVHAMVIGSARADVVTGTAGDDVLIGGAGADTFTWLTGQGGSDTVLDFSLAQDDRLDLTEALQGFTAGHEADYLRKFVDGNDIVIAVDREGHGDFSHADLTITLVNVQATDPITVITAAGHSVL